MKASIPAVTRRLFLGRSIATVASAALPLRSTRLFAQQASLTGAQFREWGKTAKVSKKRLRSDVNLLMGAGGNMLVLPGKGLEESDK